MKTITFQTPDGRQFSLEIDDHNYMLLEQYAERRRMTFEEAVLDVLAMGLNEAERILWRLNAQA